MSQTLRKRDFCIGCFVDHVRVPADLTVTARYHDDVEGLVGEFEYCFACFLKYLLMGCWERATLTTTYHFPEL